jgi:hypothetical protein
MCVRFSITFVMTEPNSLMIDGIITGSPCAEGCVPRERAERWQLSWAARVANVATRQVCTS